MAEKDKINLDYLNTENDNLEGFEEVNASTMKIPFLKLAQDLTLEMKKTNAQYIEGLELGDFFNPITGEIYGPKIQAVILKFQEIYIEWPPNSIVTREPLISYHTPANALNLATDQTFGKWKTIEGNDLTQYYTYYLLLAGHETDGVMIYSLKSTGISIGKGINRLMTTHQMLGKDGKPVTAKPYYLVWDVESHTKPKGAAEYYIPVFKFNSFITAEQHAIVKDERKLLPARSVDYNQITDHSSADNVDGSADDGDDEL
jgi:hypothetical protein